MIYYRVKPSFDSYSVHNKKGKFLFNLIGNELYTRRELFIKYDLPQDKIVRYFTHCNLAPSQVYFSFGVRFEKGTTAMDAYTQIDALRKAVEK